MTERHERHPDLFDGAGVIVCGKGERGRVITWDIGDGDYGVLILSRAPYIASNWFEASELAPDPEGAIPWPGEDDLPQGVLCLSMTGQPGDLEVFSSIERMLEEKPEGDANALRNMALQAVADPGEWIRDGGDDIVLVSFQLLDQGGGDR